MKKLKSLRALKPSVGRLKQRERAWDRILRVVIMVGPPAVCALISGV